eukprot:04320.XXX_57662_57987_1 [CDS] Oithona nana genome sequencing.
MRIGAPKEIFSLRDLIPFGVHWVKFLRNEISGEEFIKQLFIGMGSCVGSAGIAVAIAVKMGSPLGIAVAVIAGLASNVILTGILNVGVNVYSQRKQGERVADSEEELKA